MRANRTIGADAAILTLSRGSEETEERGHHKETQGGFSCALITVGKGHHTAPSGDLVLTGREMEASWPS